MFMPAPAGPGPEMVLRVLVADLVLVDQLLHAGAS